jgi:hypothetical protein
VYAFIHIAKTGGSTLRHALRATFGARHCDIKVPPRQRAQQEWVTAHDLRLAQSVYPRLAGICGHRVTSFSGLEEAVPAIRYFTFLRDPARRYISHFLHFLRDRQLPCTAEQLHRFAEDPLQQNVMTRMLCGRESATAAIAELDEKAIFVGLTTQFDTSYVLFRQWLGEPRFPANYAFRNANTMACPLPLTEDPDFIRLIQQANTEDIRVYQYVLDEVFPRQVNAFDGPLAAEVTALQSAQGQPLRLTEPLWARIKRRYAYKPLLHLTGFPTQARQRHNAAP